MRLLENLVAELFQNSVEYLVDGVIQTDSWMYVFMLVAIVIWSLSAIYQIMKGIYKSIIDTMRKYKYKKEIKRVNKQIYQRRRPYVRTKL